MHEFFLQRNQCTQMSISTSFELLKGHFSKTSKIYASEPLETLIKIMHSLCGIVLATGAIFQTYYCYFNLKQSEKRDITACIRRVTQAKIAANTISECVLLVSRH